VDALHAVVGVGHQQFGGGQRAALTRPLRISPRGRDIGQHPGLVAVFLGDIVGHGVAQPFVFGFETAAGGHQQRHRVPDVMIGLGEKVHVLLAGDRAAQAAGEDGSGQQPFPIRPGIFLQLPVETHRGDSWY
jgi:hypothetical protein